MEQHLTDNHPLIEFRKKHFLPTAALYYRKPLQLVKAKGEYVFDEQGREYLDVIGGIVSISAGHNHPRINKALREMLDGDEIQHTTLLYLNRHVVDLAKKLVEEAPKGLSRICFTNSGSEANEMAFLVSRQFSAETTIVSLRLGYHGGTSGTLAQCGQFTWKYRSQPVVSSTMAEAPYCYRCPFGKTVSSCSLECAQHIEQTIQTTTHGRIAAFIAEPVMGVAGYITPPDAYFSEAARIVHQYGGIYISDEVQTGVGRCGGDFFVARELGIDADMITMAKGFGNGAPIGAVVMRSELADSLQGKLHFNTFGGDPFQCEQARLTMEIIREEGLIANSRTVGARLMDGLKNMMSKYALIGDVRGRGLLIGVEMVRDRKTKEYATKECADFMERCKDKGLLVGKGGLFGNVIRIAPPLTLKKEQADFVLRVMDETFSEMKP